MPPFHASFTGKFAPVFDKLVGVGLFVALCLIGCSSNDSPATSIPVPVSLEGMNGDLVLEINRLTKQLEAEDRGSKNFLELANVYQANGLIELSVAAYELYLHSHDGDAKAWYFASLAFFQASDLERAIDCLQHAESVAPEYGPIY